MREFTFTIKDALGIHARPASLLTKIATSCDSEVSIVKDGKEVSMNRMLAIMTMQIKCGDQVTIKIDGNDEGAVYEQLKDFFEKNL